MVDIAMCRRQDCPRRLSCFRYLAEPDDWQSYIAIKDVDKCDMYWQVKNRKELAYMNKLNEF